MILHCMEIGSLVCSTLQVVTTFSPLVIMAWLRYARLGIVWVIYALISVGDTNQILWNEDEDDREDFTKLNAPFAPHYHRRFTAHFTKTTSGYEPTIVCYIPKESKLQVHVQLWMIKKQEQRFSVGDFFLSFCLNVWLSKMHCVLLWDLIVS